MKRRFPFQSFLDDGVRCPERRFIPITRGLGLTSVMLLVLLLSGCAFSPEQAVIRDRSSFLPEAVESTMQVRQSVPWQGGQVVMLSYDVVRPEGQVSECVSIYLAFRRTGTWYVKSGGGGCGPVGGSGDPIGVNTGSSSSPSSTWSRAGGLVYDPEIVSVEVTWEDGATQRVDVVNQSYLALRDGMHSLAQAQGLDENDQVNYTFESSPPAAGKRVP